MESRAWQKTFYSTHVTVADKNSLWFINSLIQLLFAINLKRGTLKADFALSPIVMRTQILSLLLTKEGAHYNGENTVSK